MTISITQKTLLIATLAIVCGAPAFAQAEESTPLTTLQTQYKSLIERFESMKKNKGAATTTKEKNERGGKMASSTVNRTCMASAIATREAAIGSAWTDFSADISTALTKRTDAIVTGWNSSETGSREAIKKAWTTWKTDNKAAHMALKADRKAAWDTFKKTAKDSCKVTVPKEEGLETAGKDSITL